MACPEFEELVREGAGGHAARCERCRALLEALAEVDAALEAEFVGVCAPGGLAAAVRERVAWEPRLRGPSVLPEVLDLIGWAAVLAIAAVLMPHVLPLLNAALARLG